MKKVILVTTLFPDSCAKPASFRSQNDESVIDETR